MTDMTVHQGALKPWGWVQTLDRALGNARLAWTWVQLPIQGALKYGPSVLLGLPAAYASAMFAQHMDIFPGGLGWAVGVAFEWLYLGSLAMSGQLKTSRWFHVLNGLAVFTSILFVMLHAADKYGLLVGLDGQDGWSVAALWFFALVHAAPLAGLNWIYNTLIHQHDKDQGQDALDQANQSQFTCPDCGWVPPLGHQNPAAALNGHKRHCKG